VAIIGCGPTGALLANLLGQAGLSVIVLERDSDIHALPRAVHVDGEVFRIFQSVGLADRIAQVARPSTQGMRFVNAAGETMLIRRGIDGPGPQGWVNNWYGHQPLLDAVLREGMARFPSVTLKTCHEVTALTERDGHVDLSIQDNGTGAAQNVSARYAVGCDGARSLVRQTMGSRQEDLGLHQPWLVVDMIVDPLSARVRGLAGHTIQLCDPARPMTLVNVAGGRRRWEIMLMPGDELETMTAPEHIWPLLARWIGPNDARIERAAVYTFHAVIARGWRRGPYMLAGDSCHQTPPFLGQGMCAGLRDAANLAWKLIWIVKRAAPDSLLDTYESERRPHVAEFIRLAVGLGRIIQLTDPDEAAARDLSFEAGQPKQFDFPQPQLGPGLLDGGLPDGTPKIPARPVGGVFPQPRLTDGRLLDDVTASAAGPRFALLSRSHAMPGLDAAMAARLAALDVAHVSDDSPDLLAWFHEHSCHAVLLRPDRYVMGLVRSPGDLARLVELLP
jgi:3-(3-hydroxy-phenyl)propionate hydroxylase